MQCLIARRLAEKGVRFVELTIPPSHGSDRWDAHKNLQSNHTNNALNVDQPIGALISDLKQRGMLDQTLIVFAGEFGRTPFAQGSGAGRGRDHHPQAYSIWMAGGGVKGGSTYGVTDEFGYNVLEGRMEMYDMHATMLHLLGLNHEKSTFRFSGRDMRLTDVHGHVIHEIIS
jgi:arylsulfatase A-like enzyme